MGSVMGYGVIDVWQLP